MIFIEPYNGKNTSLNRILYDIYTTKNAALCLLITIEINIYFLSCS